MNEVKLIGNVLNCYIHSGTGALIVKIAVMHDHIIGKVKETCESVFNVIMQDEEKIKTTDIMQGDRISVDGYLKMNHKRSKSGNEHHTLKVYATDIKVLTD